MENCAFCVGLRPVVYCKSDAARLCLSCDAKVHSANTLSNRHQRTLVCEACRRRPVYVRCFDHEMFMCLSCDNIHHPSSQHQKKVVKSYTGCPSAIDLAALWGFDLNELENQDQYVFASVRGDSGGVSSNISAESCSQSQTGSSSQNAKVVSRRKNTSIILQQIADLKRLQLSEGSENCCLVRGKGITEQSSFKYDAEHSLDQHHEHQYMGSSLCEEMPDESFLSQLGNLISNDNPLQGDTFWQCKNPNELWPQNMQDIGVCDELECFDDLHIPDVDLTFRNFEELFGGEQAQDQARVLVDDENMECSFADKHSSFSGRSNEDMSGATSGNKVFDSSSQVRPINTSYLTSSFSISRITAESSSSECKADGFSPEVDEQILLRDSTNPVNANLDAEENEVMRSKDNKAWGYEKRARHSSQKAKPKGKKC